MTNRRIPVSLPLLLSTTLLLATTLSGTLFANPIPCQESFWPEEGPGAGEFTFTYQGSQAVGGKIAPVVIYRDGVNIEANWEKIEDDTYVAVDTCVPVGSHTYSFSFLHGTGEFDCIQSEDFTVYSDSNGSGCSNHSSDPPRGFFGPFDSQASEESEQDGVLDSKKKDSEASGCVVGRVPHTLAWLLLVTLGLLLLMLRRLRGRLGLSRGIFLVVCGVGLSASPAHADCVPDCQGRFCGDDGCGGSCGLCEEGVCIEGACLSDCSFIPEEGCCADNVLLRCIYKDHFPYEEVVASDCSGVPSCGWSDFWFGYACGSDGKENPLYPKACDIDCSGFCADRECGPGKCGDSCGECSGDQAMCLEGKCCVPDCSTAMCGDDGCGSSCGECDGDSVCFKGSCCDPQCEGRDCGDNGCGGSCGYCNGGKECIGGLCVRDCYGIPLEGCCLGDKLYRCAGPFSLWVQDCAASSCGWTYHIGTDTSSYRCGGEGEDPSGEHSIECHFECTGFCDERECGLTPCGGSCGECPSGQVCIDGDCCQPDCEGRECGEDPVCQSSCGTCEEGHCSQQGVCTANWCKFFECGKSPSGEVDCGSCPEGEVCSEGFCCKPDCSARECGEDPVCHTNCGSCGGGQVECLEGICTPTWGATVSDLPGCPCCTCQECVCDILPGCCKYGWNKECAWTCENYCGGFGFDGKPHCQGKTCGDDGSFGSCGECSNGQVCYEGNCCKPECSGKNCGDDGCGGTCGECIEGQPCLSGTCCTPNCENRCSGDDGCGGVCGDCGVGAYCQDGICHSDCFNECEGMQCGTGKCGGPCSPGRQCGESFLVCIDGVCMADCGGMSADKGCCMGGKLYRGCGNGYPNLGMKVEDCHPEKGGTCGWRMDPECDYNDYYYDYSYSYCTDEGFANYCGGEGADPDGIYPNECPMLCRGPVCLGKECGPDGCGGNCGVCDDGFACHDGTCLKQDCDGKECGTDGIGGWCGGCPSGQQCNASGHCIACETPCKGRECGPDGCGGYCGHCLSSMACVDGTCIGPNNGLSPKHCCWGDVLVSVNDWNGSVSLQKCGPGANYCGWDPKWERYSCNSDGGVDPSGEYPKDCLAQCFPACWRKKCGDDGCGGTCGECLPGEICSERGKCEANSQSALTWQLDENGNNTHLLNANASGKGGSCSTPPTTSPPNEVFLLFLTLFLGLAIFRRLQTPLKPGR